MIHGEKDAAGCTSSDTIHTYVLALHYIMTLPRVQFREKKVY